jgi:hypothetical protein
MAFKCTCCPIFREADCDADHHLVVATLTERLAVIKRMIKKMDMERLNLKKLNDWEVKKHYQVTIKNKLATLENQRIMRT